MLLVLATNKHLPRGDIAPPAIDNDAARRPMNKWPDIALKLQAQAALVVDRTAVTDLPQCCRLYTKALDSKLLALNGTAILFRGRWLRKSVLTASQIVNHNRLSSAHVVMPDGATLANKHVDLLRL